MASGCATESLRFSHPLHHYIMPYTVMNFNEMSKELNTELHPAEEAGVHYGDPSRRSRSNEENSLTPTLHGTSPCDRKAIAYHTEPATSGAPTRAPRKS